MAHKNDDYRSDEEDELSSISLSSKDSKDLSNQFGDSLNDSYQENKKKKKKDRKLQKNKNKKKKLNKLWEEEAEETDEEESDFHHDDGIRPELKKKEQQRYEEDFLKKKVKRLDLAQQLEEKYKDGANVDVIEQDVSDEDMEFEPPGIRDAKIWRVGCHKGKEQEGVMNIMFKYQHFLTTDQPLEIVSAFSLKKFPSVIFVEAYFEAHVLRAIEGLVSIRQSGLEILEPDQCVGLFGSVEMESLDIQEGQWVRIRQHALYQGDLGRVMKVEQEQRRVKVKVIQRQKLPKKSTTEEQNQNQGKKEQGRFQIKEELEDQMEEVIEDKPENQYYRRGKFFRKQRMLAEQQRKYMRGPKIPIQVQKKHHLNDGDDLEMQSAFFYRNVRDEYTQAKKDGFDVITLPAHFIVTGKVKPTAEELVYFYPDVSDVKQIIAKMYSSLKQVLDEKPKVQIGDQVYVTQNGQITKFKVTKIVPEKDEYIVEKAKFNKETGEKKIYQYTVKASEATLAFSLYQEVVVISGPNAGASGAIIKINENTATITTEAKKIINVSLDDLQLQRNVIKIPQQQVEQQETNNTTNNNGIKRNDLIKFGQIDMDVGCVLNMQNNEVKVLDLTNTIKIINEMQVLSQIHTRNNVAKNIHGNDIRQKDLVVVLDGFYKNCKATVLHVYRDYLFLFNGQFDNTGGVIIEKINNCGLISSNYNPNKIEQSNKTTATKSTPNDELKSLLGQYITIKKGQWMGYKGLVVSVSAKLIEVQLTAKNFTVKVPIDQVKSDQHIQSQLAPGKTPHHAPGMSTRVWDDLDNRPSVMHAYQSPYVTSYTPYHEQH